MANSPFFSLGKELESHRLCSERSNKRVHGYSTKSENEYKRIKCERAENFQLTNQNVVISGMQEGSQLLHRLVTADMPKNWQNQLEMRERLAKDDNNTSVGGGVSGGDGGGGGVVIVDDDDDLGEGGGDGGINYNDIDYNDDDDGGGCGDLVKSRQGTASKSITSQQSNSVLMNLLVSGCDVSAGYVCLTKPKPSKGITSK